MALWFPFAARSDDCLVWLRPAKRVDPALETARASQLEATIVSVDQSRFVGNKARGGASIYNLDGSTLTIKGSKYPARSIHNPAAAK